MWLCGKWMKSRSALSVPALTQNHISVLRRTDKWRGEERRGGPGPFFGSFIEFSTVTYAKSNFLARVNPCLAVVKFCYPRRKEGRLLSKLYARV